MAKTRLSTKGQIVIPRAVREAHRWESGAELEIEDRPDGVFLRAVRTSPTRVEDVLGCTGYRGRRKSVADMERSVAAEAKRRGRT